MSKELFEWPLEAAWPGDPEDFFWHDHWANRILDFHGDPLRAKICLFSDGNHHMALAEALRTYVQQHPEVGDIFYVTLPPPALLSLVSAGVVRIGNLRLRLKPDLFIGPRETTTLLQKEHKLFEPRMFAKSKGIALLVPKHNPKSIDTVADLLRDDVRTFISNPTKERASHRVYLQALCHWAKALGMNQHTLQQRLAIPSAQTMHGSLVHHREAPAAIASGDADVAPVYYHLALRYSRIFQHEFEYITPQETVRDMLEKTVVTQYCIGLAESDNPLAKPLQAFMCSETVRGIYEKHGLIGVESAQVIKDN